MASRHNRAKRGRHFEKRDKGRKGTPLDPRVPGERARDDGDVPATDGFSDEENEKSHVPPREAMKPQHSDNN
jgi:hypothetical protein